MASATNVAIRLVRRLEGESSTKKVKEELFEVFNDNSSLSTQVLELVCSYQEQFPRVYNILKGANNG